MQQLTKEPRHRYLPTDVIPAQPTEKSRLDCLAAPTTAMPQPIKFALVFHPHFANFAAKILHSFDEAFLTTDVRFRLPCSSNRQNV